MSVDYVVTLLKQADPASGVHPEVLPHEDVATYLATLERRKASPQVAEEAKRPIRDIEPWWRRGPALAAATAVVLMVVGFGIGWWTVTDTGPSLEGVSAEKAAVLEDWMDAVNTGDPVAALLLHSDALVCSGAWETCENLYGFLVATGADVTITDCLPDNLGDTCSVEVKSDFIAAVGFDAATYTWNIVVREGVIVAVNDRPATTHHTRYQYSGDSPTDAAFIEFVAERQPDLLSPDGDLALTAANAAQIVEIATQFTDGRS